PHAGDRNTRARREDRRVAGHQRELVSDVTYDRVSSIIASSDCFSASRVFNAHFHPSDSMRAIDSRTIGTSPFHPRSPPVNSYRTDLRPRHSTARSAISRTVM